LEYAKTRSVICVDVQPEYSGIHDGDENPVFEEIIRFVNNQRGPVLMFVNAEDAGMSGDTVQDVRAYWEDSGFDPSNWSRVTVVDKGYGYLRTWMDSGIPPAVIIKVIREMYRQKTNDSRHLWDDDALYRENLPKLVGPSFKPWMFDDGLFTEWTSVAQLKRFAGSYIVGGGRNECLREVELLMNAFNIPYKRVDSLVYG
jgi:hypothetical protein